MNRKCVVPVTCQSAALFDDPTHTNKLCVFQVGVSGYHQNRPCPDSEWCKEGNIPSKLTRST